MTTEKRFQVFISSTYSDLKDERDAITRSIMELGSIPAGMEAFPAADEEQFEFIKKVIDDSDYYVVILAARYGSVASDGVGYTEKEYNYAVSLGLPVLAFVHEDPKSFFGGASDLNDNKKAQEFFRFRDQLLTNRIAKLWNNSNQLVTQVVLSLSRAFQTKPRPGWVRGDSVASKEILEEVARLQKANIELSAKLQSKEKEDELGASYDDLHASVTLTGTYDYRFNNNYAAETKTWESRLTFEKVFKKYSPSLAESLNVETLNYYIASDYSDTKESRGSISNLKTSRDTMNELRVQFEAIGLIEVFQATTVSKSVGTFWRLTNRGKMLMHSLNVKRVGGKV